MREELYFTAFGIPRPQGSKKPIGRGRFVESSQGLKPWRKAIAEAVFRAWVATGDDRPFTEPVVVWATFYLPKPKSVRRLFPSVAPDLDKLQRALGDALSVDSAAIASDALIVEWVARKVYAASPGEVGVRVGIRRATEFQLERLRELSEQIRRHELEELEREAAEFPFRCLYCGR